ncbi:MAG: hypothetical protein AB9903_23155 [Vulcanimicrobiota bacterium]
MITAFKLYLSRNRKHILVLAALCLLLIVSGCKDGKVTMSFDSYTESGGRLENIRTVAIVGFSGDRSWQDEMKASLAYHLRLSGYVSVMDPRESDAILSSKGISMDGGFTAEKAVEAAEALKVDGLVYGSSNGVFHTAVRYREPELPAAALLRCRRQVILYRPAYSIPYLYREGHVSVVLRFYDAHIHRDVGSFQTDTDYSREFNTFFSHSVKPMAPFFFDRAYQAEMPSDFQMKVLMADRLTGRILTQFWPFYVEKSRPLQGEDEGVHLACEGKWKEAQDFWERSVKSGVEDWKTLLNLAVCLERSGNIGRAAPLYLKAEEKAGGEPLPSLYRRQAEQALAARNALAPLDISPSSISFRILEIKSDGAIYLNAGEEENVREGDRFTVLRSRVEYDNQFRAPQREFCYPVGTVTVLKVFKGVSSGKLTFSAGGNLPKKGDAAIKEIKR